MNFKSSVALFVGLSVIIACSSPGTRTIRSSTRTILESPDNQAVTDAAVIRIWQVLRSEFPENQFSRSYTLEELKAKLPWAIREGKPFLIAFAPDTTFGHGSWDWTTYFRELAGHRAKLQHIAPEIYTLQAKMYYLPPESTRMSHPVNIGAFGKGSFQWACTGDFDGSRVEMHFGKVPVISYTVFHNPSAPPLPPDQMPPPPSREE
ncbi:MAG TPA: hypothetical protein PK711_03195 [Bacteroidales bacterium]|nr:hypothetical protein [Bacteroidales bacterium]HRZ21695.1 hypothetical protein [Bacteroidales bacterium]